MFSMLSRLEVITKLSKSERGIDRQKWMDRERGRYRRKKEDRQSLKEWESQ